MRVLLAFLLFFAAQPAKALELDIGLSADAVSITSNFDGDIVTVFGTIAGADEGPLGLAGYDIVVALVGPTEDTVVRRKERRIGLWINGDSMEFLDVPSFYSLASNRALIEIAEPPVLARAEVGFSNLSLSNGATLIDNSEIPLFRASLNRLKEAQDLSLKRIGGVEFLSANLFRARLGVPANVPIGRHVARVWLFKNGEMVARNSSVLNVRKIGFEQFMYDFAHKQGLLYGIVAVLLAMFTGWLASVVFRKD